MNHVHQDRRRALIIAAACLAAALLIGLAYPLAIPPVLAGDGSEYLLMLQAWFDHASPDLRPADIEAMDLVVPSERPFSRLVDPWAGFVQARNGRWYSMHFWLYPLLGVPAKLIFRIAGAGEFAALQSANVFCFILAVCFAFFNGSRERSRRLLFIALAAVGPVIWLLRWPHPEVFTWCCAMVSLTLLGRKRHGLAAAAAAVGSLQNPPLILLALLPLAITASRRQGRQALNAAAGLLPALIAPFFYLYHYGVSSLIADSGGVDFLLISPMRTLSFFADLNQGMLPYVPLLLLLGIAGAVTALVRRRWDAVGLAAVIAGIILLIQSAPNWNNGTAGMLRYAVWMTPLFAWLAAEQLTISRWPLRALVVAGLLLQAVLVFRAGETTYVHPSPLAAWAMDRFPTLVHPEPEIFTERQVGRDGDWDTRLPVGFIGADGSMVKILAEVKSLEQIARRFGLDQGEIPGLVHRLDHPYFDVLYLHPPRGLIKVVEPVDWGEQALQTGLRWDLVDLPGAILHPEARFRLEVVNSARYRFWGESSGARFPLTFICRIFEDGEELSFFPVHAPLDIAPGETVLLPVRVTLPRRPGRFRVELQAALRSLVWDERRAGFSVEVLGVDDRSYLARVVRNETESHPRQDPAGS